MQNYIQSGGATCDEAKKQHCKSQGKICNEKTGRCNKVYEPKIKKKRGRPKKKVEVVDADADKLTKQQQKIDKENKANLKLVNKIKPVVPVKNTIFVLHTKHDHNSAFDKDGDAGLFNFFRRLKHFRFLYQKVGTMNDIVKAFSKVKTPIAHLVIMAHGNRDSIFLTKTGIKRGTKDFDIFSNLLQRHLAPESSVLLHSCLVGYGGTKKMNFANALSKKLKNHVVFGSNKSIARNELFVMLAEPDLKRGILNMEYFLDVPKPFKMFKFLSTTKGNMKGAGNKNVEYIKFKF